ncbi:TcmI family type II polyketide cyclase [Streptomyces lunaelactis]|uniref:TcmI family type II polyketide cyclase n=1 Tax=Streptomyces lunaelactis TaxID=1535768 RepID=A0A2R4TA95_9ACTN|nr:SchA/CurD-like domain-containing protein [Streptomyces lunaelactis]AVZ76017.1 TcmI family type II polyketide cyclase [Streptomyces lunaelactis]NUJ99779.1 antibiotic biosynthesis monooxygenase [Streptomyces lunaelactis]NUK09574.1 antibiotic biosynthesis monooxygenase [Streptomyces lunaelactis]NUK13953.1 antibiotic biosynthesis monooxygenase [Streptomyces lunaelactis]NUK25784.1 antibiotic biosynthesis monooxygenase [Streptomyces lunaelactis]
MTTLSERISQSAFDGSRLRVVLLLDLHDGAQKQFLEAYEHLRNQVASVPGHISDQLCQSIENPSQWLITSEWESAPPFLAWVNSEEHVETVQPLHSCVRDTRSLRFSVLRETGQPAVAPEPHKGLQAAPRVGDGVVRHALTFTVKPGSEKKVAKILAGYTSPAAHVDEHTRLRRTSLFMHGNRVVRAIEVHGDLLAALRHVSQQPEVRAVEEAINPYLEQDRDLNDPNSARVFFTRAALPAVHHVAADGQNPADVNRHALFYQAKDGCGMALARLLAGQDEAAADSPSSPIVSSTIFQRDDIVVRLIDLTGPLDARPALSFGVEGPHKAATLTRLLADGKDGVPVSDEEISGVLARSDMHLITDRSAAPES